MRTLRWLKFLVLKSFFFSSRRRHTRWTGDWSSDVCSSDLNLLNPRPGTKFGDRELLDPWEAVKWIAIFRLILPDALFRLCGGRVENLRDLQTRSEERRVGKECRSRWSAYH